MRIRRATEHDANAIHELLVRCGGDGMLAPVEPTLGDIEVFLRSGSAGAFMIGDSSGDAGVAMYDRQGDVLWLFRVAVEPAARGRGLGKALVNAVEAAAQGTGLSAVFVQIPAQLESRQFFETLGYRTDLEEPDVIGGQSVTLIDLVKLV